jgi:hypothetical protein
VTGLKDVSGGMFLLITVMITTAVGMSGRMFEMPDIEYVFFVQNVFLHLEIVYHISKCKNIMNKEKHPVFL